MHCYCKNSVSVLWERGILITCGDFTNSSLYVMSQLSSLIHLVPNCCRYLHFISDTEVSTIPVLEVCAFCRFLQTCTLISVSRD